MPISDGAAPWLDRFGFPFNWPAVSFRPGTRLCIVIPVLGEPHLEETLQSLFQCSRPSCLVDIILVLNYPDGSDLSVTQWYLENKETAEKWEHALSGGKLRNINILAPALPPKWAGAGLARKVGMDFVVNYTGGSTIGDPLIVCLDADCTVSPNYLMELERVSASEDFDACSLYFEHSIDDIDDAFHRKVITEYELYLRYYVRGLRWAGYPFAFHTVGSSMAVRCSAYMKYGGMNRRKAGEDFYFLHKIIPHGRFLEVNSLTVFPSGRPSFRVPFGTGKTVSDRLSSGDPDYLVYHPEIFETLREWLLSVTESTGLKERLTGWEDSTPEPVAAYLKTRNFSDLVMQWIQNTASDEAFARRFLHWLDGFEMLKLVHFLRDHHFGLMEVSMAATQLLKACGILTPNSEYGTRATELLTVYRELDKADDWRLENFR